MFNRVTLALVAMAVIALPAAASTEHQRQVRMARVSADSIPRDLASPEGTTRWDLSEVRLEGSWLRSLGTADGSARFSDLGATDVPAAPTVFEDPSGGEAADPKYA